MPSAGLQYSVSCTTRPPRADEVDGRDYHFLSTAAFDDRVRAGKFLEHAEVHGFRYGTPLGPVVSSLAAGQDVILDIDTKGAVQIRASRHPAVVRALCDIFLMPPGLEALRDRLLSRGTENAAQLAIRLHNAREEMRGWRAYRYTIISETPSADCRRFQAIVEAERCLTTRLATSDPASP